MAGCSVFAGRHYSAKAADLDILRMVPIGLEFARCNHSMERMHDPIDQNLRKSIG